MNDDQISLYQDDDASAPPTASSFNLVSADMNEASWEDDAVLDVPLSSAALVSCDPFLSFPANFC